MPDCGQKDIDEAIAAATSAFTTFRDTNVYDRAALLTRIATLSRHHAPDIARTMSMEQGKPLKEAEREVAYGISYIEWYSEEAKRSYGETIPAHTPGQSIIVLPEPIGVCGIITPWNFPFAMLARKIAPALAAGCTVVCKPAPETPLTALFFARICQEAGVPAGVLNMITGDAEMIGAALMNHPAVRKVSFTGSTEVGKLLMQQSAETVKKLTLELGGNAPFIVFDDADLPKTIAAAVSRKYQNAGQACTSVNRFLIQKNIADDFVKELIRATSQLKVANGLDSQSDIGPLISLDAARKVQELLQDAKDKGAQFPLGEIPRGDSQWVHPVVMTNITSAMRLWREEIFGPVAAVRTFADEEEAVALANDTTYGLAAYLYTEDFKRLTRVARRLEAGMVGCNDIVLQNAQAPFGGIKQSGFGREGGAQGLQEFMSLKYIVMNGI